MFHYFDYNWFNFSSIFLGLIAWFILIFSIINRKKRRVCNPIMILLSTELAQPLCDFK